MNAFYFNVWVDVIDLCGEVVEVVCLWDLVDAQPWSLVTVALWEVDVYVLAKVLWVVSVVLDEGIDVFLFFWGDYDASFFELFDGECFSRKC